jgi:hypothetical protein
MAGGNNPPRNGEGDHPQGGGGAQADKPAISWLRIAEGAPPPASLVPLPVPGRNCA